MKIVFFSHFGRGFNSFVLTHLNHSFSIDFRHVIGKIQNSLLRHFMQWRQWNFGQQLSKTLFNPTWRYDERFSKHSHFSINFTTHWNVTIDSFRKIIFNRTNWILLLTSNGLDITRCLNTILWIFGPVSTFLPSYHNNFVLENFSYCFPLQLGWCYEAERFCLAEYSCLCLCSMSLRSFFNICTYFLPFAFQIRWDLLLHCNPDFIENNMEKNGPMNRTSAEMK